MRQRIRNPSMAILALAGALGGCGPLRYVTPEDRAVAWQTAQVGRTLAAHADPDVASAGADAEANAWSTMDALGGPPPERLRRPYSTEASSTLRQAAAQARQDASGNAIGVLGAFGSMGGLATALGAVTGGGGLLALLLRYRGAAMAGVRALAAAQAAVPEEHRGAVKAEVARVTQGTHAQRLYRTMRDTGQV